MEKYEVSVFNTITKQYEMVEVSKEVYEVYRRTGWNAEKDDKRFHSHITNASDMECDFKDAFESLSSYVNECILRFEREMEHLEIKEIISKALEELNPKERELINAIYFEGKTLEQYGSELGVSKQTIHQRRNRILRILKTKILKNLSEKS